MARTDQESVELQNKVDTLTREAASLKDEQKTLESTIDIANVDISTLDKDTDFQIRKIKGDADTRKRELDKQIKDGKRKIALNKNRLTELARELEQQNDALTVMQQQVRESLKKRG